MALENILQHMEATISSYCEIPEDLIIEILLFLPVKSLIRFRSVCQRWYAIIWSRSFTNLHFHHKTNCARLFMYQPRNCYPNSMTFPSFSLLSDQTLKSPEEQHHMQLPGRYLALFGPCNGIFCVYISIHKFALWNPATRRLRPLSPPPLSIYESEIGFGIDPLTNEYKIVLIRSGRGTSPHFVVYTSNNDYWRQVEENHFRDLFPKGTPINTTFLNGFYYRYSYNKMTSTGNILQFDMHREVFEEIELPYIVGSTSIGKLYSYNDSLALFTCDHVDVEQIHIWLMEEKGCWKKLSILVLPLPIFSILGFGNRKILLETYDDVYMSHVLTIYDFDSRNTNNVKFLSSTQKEGIRVFFYYYKESLVSIQGIYGINDYDIRSSESFEYFSSP